MASVWSLSGNGYQNDIMLDDNLYYLDMVYYKMNKYNKNNIFTYQCDLYYNLSELNTLNGMIIELDEIILENIFWKEQICDLVTKIKLNIYLINKKYDDELKEMIDKGSEFIGELPLYLGDYKYIKNKIIIKFPKYFFNQCNYFFKFQFLRIEFGLELGLGHVLLPIQMQNIFKNVNLYIIGKVMLDQEYYMMGSYMKFLSHNPIQYCLNIPISLNNSAEINEVNQIHKIQFQIKKIEKIRGFFVNIPSELDDVIYNIRLNLKKLNSTKIIYLENNLQEYNYIGVTKYKQNDLYTVYWIGINNLDINPFDHNLENITYCLTEPTDDIEIFIDLSINDFDTIVNHIKNISIDLLVSNYLTGTNFNQNLKFINGNLHPDLVTDSDWIEKNNQSLNDKIKNIIIEYNDIIKNKIPHKYMSLDPNYYNIERYLNDNNLIYLAKKYIELY